LGGIAHIMLAGKAPFKSKYPNRYAKNGIKNLIQKLNKNGVSGDYIACLVGAGNVLKRKDDTICTSNKASVMKVLHHYNIPVIKQSLGGTERRSVKYKIGANQVFYTKADSDEMLLYEMGI
jgi:chemotaxis receptor (MCP) glutamine deamidase CheD